MSSQDSKMHTDSNFNYKDVLITLENESVLLKKIQCMDDLVSNYLSTIPGADIDIAVLSSLLPQAKGVFEKIFEQTIELIYENDEEEVCTQTLTILQEYLQMVIMLLEILRDLLDFVIGKNTVDFLSIRSLPVCTAQILYITFLHCKESNSIYKNYFDSLNEILTVFKKAQEVHSKLLSILESTVVYNVSCEAEVISLNEVLDALTELGNVLSGVNVKSMADNWKSYMNLTQKYASELKDHINIERPLLHFTSELVRNLINVLEMNMHDNKNITHTLKISNFSLRVILKLYDCFPKQINTHMNILWNFFMNFYSIYLPAVRNRRFSDNTINLLKSLICNGLDQFLSKLIQVKEFHDVHLLETIKTTDCSAGFILVTNIVLQKLVSGRRQSISDVNISQYLNIILIAMSKSYTLFMKDHIYEELLVSIVDLISLSNNEQFSEIELILYRNLQAASMWNAFFAYDVWTMICRTCNAKYTFDLLCWIVEKFETIWKAQYTARPELVITSNFIAELYQILSESYKLQFIRKYPLNTQLHIWKHIGLKNFPNSCVRQVEDLLCDLSEKIPKFDGETCTYEEYLIMVEEMSIFGTAPLEEMYFDLKRLNLLLKNMWNFNSSNKSLLEHSIFKLFLGNLVKLTQNLTWRLHNTELIQILNQMKLDCEQDNFSKSLLLLLINSILDKSPDFSQEQQVIVETISEILSSFLIDDCIVIKIAALDLFQKSTNNTAWCEVSRNITSKNAHLRRLITNFMDVKILSNANTLRTCAVLEQVQFRHECLANPPFEPRLKKKKVSEITSAPPEAVVMRKNVENVEATRVIQRIRKDVQHLGNLVGKDDLTVQNTKDIVYILKELQNYE